MRKTRTPSRTELEALTVAEALSSEDIARRAYELFLARGGEHGRHMDDWLQAERELMAARQARK